MELINLGNYLLNFTHVACKSQVSDIWWVEIGRSAGLLSKFNGHHLLHKRPVFRLLACFERIYQEILLILPALFLISIFHFSLLRFFFGWQRKFY